MQQSPRRSGNRTLFSFRIETVAGRPDIMTAPALDISSVRDADFSFLRDNASLRVLYLSEAHSLRGIEALPQVRELVLVHIPKVHSLEPLGALRDLQVLTIATTPSWDASRKCIEVDSFTPLGRLKALISLSLVGVRPARGGLRPLRRLTGLRVLHISHVFSFRLRDYAELAAHLPATVGPCLRPCSTMRFEMPCKKCGQQLVALTGARPPARRFLCLDCDKPRLLEHFAAWASIAGREFPYPRAAKDVAVEPSLHYA